MTPKLRAPVFLAFLVLAAEAAPLFAGDSLYGKVTSVKSVDVVVFNHGTGTYVVHIAGVVPPLNALKAKKSKQFLENLVMRKREGIRLRIEYFDKAGEVVGRLLTDDPDPAFGIKDVGFELINLGWAGHDPGFDYGFGELAAAEKDAKEHHRHMWAR